MPRNRLGVVLLLFLLCAPPLAAAEVRDLEAVLAEMHPDYRTYIGDVRPFPDGVDPRNVYMGLVRPGGRDPRRREDAPESRASGRYDLLVAPGTAAGSTAWTRLLLDHEYFHARHLARADHLPAPAFADPSANRHYHEALAWGQNLERTREGAYGGLPLHRLAEAQERYGKHRAALRQYVLRRQPAAWAYYGRFLPEFPAAPQISLAGTR